MRQQQYQGQTVWNFHLSGLIELRQFSVSFPATNKHFLLEFSSSWNRKNWLEETIPVSADTRTLEISAVFWWILFQRQAPPHPVHLKKGTAIQKHGIFRIWIFGRVLAKDIHTTIQIWLPGSLFLNMNWKTKLAKQRKKVKT